MTIFHQVNYHHSNKSSSKWTSTDAIFTRGADLYRTIHFHHMSKFSSNSGIITTVIYLMSDEIDE